MRRIQPGGLQISRVVSRSSRPLRIRHAAILISGATAPEHPLPRITVRGNEAQRRHVAQAIAATGDFFQRAFARLPVQISIHFHRRFWIAAGYANFTGKTVNINARTHGALTPKEQQGITIHELLHGVIDHLFPEAPYLMIPFGFVSLCWGKVHHSHPMMQTWKVLDRYRLMRLAGAGVTRADLENYRALEKQAMIRTLDAAKTSWRASLERRFDELFVSRYAATATIPLNPLPERAWMRSARSLITTWKSDKVMPNPGLELLIESWRFYLTDPDLLRERDPKLFAVIESLHHAFLSGKLNRWDDVLSIVGQLRVN